MTLTFRHLFTYLLSIAMFPLYKKFLYLMRPMKGRIINEQYYMHFICEQLVILVVNCRLVVMGKVGHKMRDSQLKSVRKWTSRVACTHVSSLRTHQIIIIIVIIASLVLNTAGAGRHLVFSPLSYRSRYLEIYNYTAARDVAWNSILLSSTQAWSLMTGCGRLCALRDIGNRHVSLKQISGRSFVGKL